MTGAIPVLDPVIWLPTDRQDLPDGAITLKAMLYAPGLLCEHCNQLLNTGFVFTTQGRLQLTGQVCLFTGFDEPASDFVRQVEQAQFYGPLWPVDESRIKRKWRWMARALGLLLQVEPGHPFAMGMFRLLETGQALKPQQASVLESMVAERGGLKAMKRRRDLLHRLARLSALPLKRADFEWVLDVSRWARGWRDGRLNELTQKQAHKIIYLEESHVAERREQVRVVLNSCSMEYAQ